MEEKAKVIFENNNFLILDKRAGVTCTKEGKEYEMGTIEDWLREKYGDNGLPREGIVHRLDKGTQGLMVVAKNSKYREKLLKLFKNRQIKKIYWALIEGELPEKGEIKVPIGRSRYKFDRFAVREDGKKAETHFRVIKKYFFKDKYYSLVEVDLKSGRTHQIRVHFSYLGWPLVGDETYRGHELMGLKSPFLVAKKLAFDKYSFEIELPDNLNKILEQL
ncbi:MAG: RNA pseudouridine synthase [Candidatus Shapirobacteria bacterium]